MHTTCVPGDHRSQKRAYDPQERTTAVSHSGSLRIKPTHLSSPENKCIFWEGEGREMVGLLKILCVCYIHVGVQGGTCESKRMLESYSTALCPQGQSLCSRDGTAAEHLLPLQKC